MLRCVVNKRSLIHKGKKHKGSDSLRRSQNIFDDKVFYDGYLKLRSRDDNYNDLLEQPAMAKLLPNMQGKKVLDLGCGSGINCVDFIRRGASLVVGADISEKMLCLAKEKSADERIKYLRMDMSDISALPYSFDMVYSSLAFHYVEDFGKLCSDICSLLNPGGRLLFSQEHPLTTATINGEGHYNKDEYGVKVSYTFSDYGKSGLRKGTWFVDDVEKYHRTMGEIITTIAKAGLIIREVVEPLPEPWVVEKNPALKKEFIKPAFLIIKAQKTE